MKPLTILGLALSLSASSFAGEETSAPISTAPASTSSPLLSWFAGGSVGYLFDNEEEFYTLHFGREIAQTGSVTHSLFLEGAYTEFSTFIIDTDVVPVTLNYKADLAITDSFSFYAGLGLGAAFVDTSVGPFSDDSVELTGQIFAGLGYDVTESFEIYGGARWIWVDDTSVGPLSVDLGDDVGAELGLRFKF